MHRGTSIASKASAALAVVASAVATEPTGGTGRARVLSTAQANAFLGKSPGFLEKRRSSGIDSPPYIQRVPRGAVTYREDDLIRWEDERMRRSTSER